jgi:hypothetical protein
MRLDPAERAVSDSGRVRAARPGTVAERMADLVEGRRHREP